MVRIRGFSLSFRRREELDVEFPSTSSRIAHPILSFTFPRLSHSSATRWYLARTYRADSLENPFILRLFLSRDRSLGIFLEFALERSFYTPPLSSPEPTVSEQLPQFTTAHLPAEPPEIFLETVHLGSPDRSAPEFDDEHKQLVGRVCARKRRSRRGSIVGQAKGSSHIDRKLVVGSQQGCPVANRNFKHERQ